MVIAKDIKENKGKLILALNTQGLVIKRTCVSLSNNTKNNNIAKSIKVMATTRTINIIRAMTNISKIMINMIKITINISKKVVTIGKIILEVDRAKRKA